MTSLGGSVVRTPGFGSFFRIISFLTFIWLPSTAVVQAASQSDVAICRGHGKRFALLIGNQDYKGLLNPLANPRRDTQAFANLLCANGFTVFRYSDLDIVGFDAALHQFASTTRGAQTTLVYYSGHGFAAGGRNWLVPIDAGLDCNNLANADSADVNFLQRKLVDLSGGVLGRLDGSGDQIVILDACRTDPIRSCFRGGSNLTLVKGFDRLSTSSGRLVLYATQNGKPARDAVAGSDTSPLMTAIVKRLPQSPQRDWLSALGDVSREVAALTQQDQVPNLDVSIPPQGCLAGNCEAAKPQSGPPAAALSDEEIAWPFLRTTTDVAALRGFVREFPAGKYRIEADNRISELTRAAQEKIVKPDPSPSGKVAMLTDGIARPARPRRESESCADRNTASGTDHYCASSRLSPEFGNSYGVRNLYGGDSSVAWVEGVSGYGIGEWITVEFDGRRSVRSVLIDNGYQKNSDIYYKNGRVKRVRLVFSAGESIVRELDDKFGTQSITLDRPINAHWVQVVIEDVYRGSKYSDTAISKLLVNSDRQQ
jgi:hypothetical protein